MLACLWVQEAEPWPVGLGFLPHQLGPAPVEGDLYLIVYRLFPRRPSGWQAPWWGLGYTLSLGLAFSVPGVAAGGALLYIHDVQPPTVRPWSLL